MNRSYDDEINARVLKAVLSDILDMVGEALIHDEGTSVARDKWHFAKMLAGRSSEPGWDVEAAERGRRWYL